MDQSQFKNKIYNKAEVSMAYFIILYTCPFQYREWDLRMRKRIMHSKTAVKIGAGLHARISFWYFFLLCLCCTFTFCHFVCDIWMLSRDPDCAKTTKWLTQKSDRPNNYVYWFMWRKFTKNCTYIRGLQIYSPYHGAPALLPPHSQKGYFYCKIYKVHILLLHRFGPTHDVLLL